MGKGGKKELTRGSYRKEINGNKGQSILSLSKDHNGDD